MKKEAVNLEREVMNVEMDAESTRSWTEGSY